MRNIWSMADPIQDLEYCSGAEVKKPSNVRFTYQHLNPKPASPGNFSFNVQLQFLPLLLPSPHKVSEPPGAFVYLCPALTGRDHRAAWRLSKLFAADLLLVYTGNGTDVL